MDWPVISAEQARKEKEERKKDGEVEVIVFDDPDERIRAEYVALAFFCFPLAQRDVSTSIQDAHIKCRFVCHRKQKKREEKLAAAKAKQEAKQEEDVSAADLKRLFVRAKLDIESHNLKNSWGTARSSRHGDERARSHTHAHTLTHTLSLWCCSTAAQGCGGAWRCGDEAADAQGSAACP